MKKRVFLACFAVLLVSVVPFVSSAQPDEPIEFIASFQAEITVREDATIHVVERIEYDFTTQERHGIIRDIPLTDAPGTFERMSVSNIQVTDENGFLHPFTYTGGEASFWSKLFSGLLIYGDVATIKIGNPLEYVTGKNTYIISYDVKDAIGYFDDRTEIYWNATGNDWLVPIERASVQVTLPGNQETEAKVASYCGESGVTTSCGEPEIHYNEKEGVTTIFYDIPKGFGFGEGATVAVGFPKTVVAAPGTQDLLMHYLFRYWGVIPIPFVLYWWFRKPLRAWLGRRRFYQNNPIVAEYDAGELSPIQASVILKGDVSATAISAQIIYLATRGFLKIHKEDNGEYSFIETEKKEGLSDSDMQLLTALAGKTQEGLKEDFHLTASLLNGEAQTNLYDRGFLTSHPIKKVSGVAACFVALFVAVNPGVFIWLLLGAQAGIAFSGLAVLIGAFSILKTGEEHLTLEGFEAARKLKGLRHYIDVAEEERITFHNAPEKNPDLFEKLLPYAMVFGLEKQWAKEFESMYVVPPTWYEGSFSNGFSSLALTESIQKFSTSAQSFYSRQVRYSSSGSSFGSSGSSFSGSSGGGSSGGGGGGGGGRSW